MKIHVMAYGSVRKYLKNKRKSELNLVGGSTASALFQKLNKPKDEIWMVSVNGIIANETTILNEGDIVYIFEPVRGG